MRHILVPIDFSDSTGPIIQTVEMLGKIFDCTIHYLHVIPSPTSENEWDLMRHAQKQFASTNPSEYRQIHAMADELRNRGCEAEALLLAGPAVEVILHEAKRLDADFVIIGSHGHGALFQVLVGSVCEGVLRKATCPVIVVPGMKKTGRVRTH